MVQERNREQYQPNWRDLLAYVKNEGMRDVNVQRYKGLGEMNAEQLWETTMNPKRARCCRSGWKTWCETRRDLHRR